MHKTDNASLRTRLESGLERMRIALTSDQCDRLIAYVLLMERWNRAYNLTAVRAPAAMVAKHLLDSLSLLPFLDGERVLDLGTGPGLPGIPLAVAQPGRGFSLLDSNAKKMRFVRQVVLDLGLDNVELILARMESFIPEMKFATIVSRAVASVRDLLAAAGHLIDRPGRFLVMKGLRPADAELQGIEPIPDELKIHCLTVPFLDAERHLVEARYD